MQPMMPREVKPASAWLGEGEGGGEGGGEGVGGGWRGGCGEGGVEEGWG